MTGKGKDIPGSKSVKGLEIGPEGKGQPGTGEGRGGGVSQKGLHSRDLWGPKGGRRGTLLSPYASKLLERKIGGVRRMRLPGREGSKDPVK